MSHYFVQPMSAAAKTRAIGFTWALLVLCFCTTTPHSLAVSSNRTLPGEVSLNADAGRGWPIVVKLRLGGGEELPFEVDTGNEWTLLDRSLEPRLGRRIAANTSTFFDGSKHPGGLYEAPPLYLGNTPLRSLVLERWHTNVVTTADLQDVLKPRRLMGILGMDCLRYYCLQIDFQGGKLRFLEPAGLRAAGLGTRFRLSYDTHGCPRISHGALLTRKSRYAMVDTGYFTGDGALEARLFQEAREHQFASGTEFRAMGQTCFPSGVWNGGTYTNLAVGVGANIVGLRFLARHLVTLDFPNDKMYLRRIAPGPLAGDQFLRLRAACDSALEFHRGLIARGQLVGGSTTGDWEFHWEAERKLTFDFAREDGSSVDHYSVTAAAESSAWKVQRAWRTDHDGHTTEEYPVP